jgi:1-deoxy-D-xylulose-5-phosphate reductoisomerase
MRNVVILGSTGSIGRNTLDVLSLLGDEFQVLSLAAKSQVDRLVEQVKNFRPARVAVADPKVEREVKKLLGSNSVELFSGAESLIDLARDAEADIVVNALVGAAGLRATMAALEAGKIVALANKESIVMAGSLVMAAVAENDGLLIPIDSEHSAVLQCLRGEDPTQVKQLILTASGGPFLRRPEKSFTQVTPREALNHPNWEMGPKITVDSATLMNKGLEVIEAHYLFNLPPERIKVVIHPQSVVHSLVEFIDGSLKAQLSQPDMRIPIQYALTYPDRLSAEFVDTNLATIGNLQFEEPDFRKFPCLNLAYRALQKGDGYPTVLNAANEVAVETFLSEKISFDRIPGLIQRALEAFTPPPVLDLNGILGADQWARQWCLEALTKN